MDSSQILDIVKIIWPIFVLQFGLEIFALIDLLKRKSVKSLSKPIWLIIILVGEIFGCVAYFVFGRGEE